MAGRFGAYDSTRDALLKRLSGGEQDVDAAKDVAPWLGDEAAFALMDTGNETAGSLIAVEVTDQEKARAFLERNPRARRPQGVQGPRDDPLRRRSRQRSSATSSSSGRTRPSRRRSTATARRAASLADDATYRKAVDDLPDDRVVTGYASADGLRRLLAPQGSVLGAVATTLDQPGLQGVALAAGPRATTSCASSSTRSSTASARARRGSRRSSRRCSRPSPRTRSPTSAPAASARRSSGSSSRPWPARARAATSPGCSRASATSSTSETDGGLRDDLLKLFEGEVALVIQRHVPAPVFSLVTHTEDEAATRRTLDRLRDPLAKLLRPAGEPAPTWKAQDLDGADAWTLTLPERRAAHLRRRRGPPDPLDEPRGRAADPPVRGLARGQRDLRGRPRIDPDQVGTLGFLDFSQLLELGEQTGLNDSQAYLRARDDLRRVRAVGVSSSSGEGESTAEILVSIP